MHRPTPRHTVTSRPFTPSAHALRSSVAFSWLHSADNRVVFIIALALRPPALGLFFSAMYFVIPVDYFQGRVHTVFSGLLSLSQLLSSTILSTVFVRVHVL